MKRPMVAIFFLGLCVPSIAFSGAGLIHWNGTSVSFNRTKVTIEGSVPSTIATGIRGGFGQWNNVNPSRSEHPWFSLVSGQGAEGDVAVKFIDGMRTPHPVTGYSACGQFVGRTDGTDGEIEIYSTGRRSTGSPPRDSMPTAGAVSDIIAHELGHYLGLENADTTDGSIMGGAADFGAENRSIHPCEAEAVDTINHTQAEEFGECDRLSFDPCDSGGTNSPIIIDFGNPGFALTSIREGVRFDIDADREQEAVSWTAAGALDAFLARDVNHNGKIDHGRELFGSATIGLSSGEIWENGYKPLAEFDSVELGGNKNGVIDESDLVYDQLLLWFDFNHNGTSEDDELFGLAELGVERISVRYRKGQDVDEYGNEFRYVSKAWIRVKNRLQTVPTADVFFVTSD